MLFGGETAHSYYEEGLTAAMKGEFEQAIRYFMRAMELDATLYNAQHQIGRCLMRQGKAEEALPRLKRAAAALPDLAAPKVDFGFALLQTGRTDAARDLFSEVLESKPAEARAVLGLAYCAFDRKQWDTVINLVQRTLEMGRSQFDAHYLFARAADKAGMPDLAIQHFQEAISLMDRSIDATPEQVPGYYLRALACIGLNQYGGALEDLRSALQYATPDRHYSAYNEYFTSEDIRRLLETVLENLGGATAGPTPENDSNAP